MSFPILGYERLTCLAGIFSGFPYVFALMERQGTEGNLWPISGKD